MSAELDVAVVGGGISGLTAAHALVARRPELRLALLESSSRVGGCIETERRDGYVIEGGPDSFLRTKPDAAELCRELGLGEQLASVRPEARSAYLVRDGALEPLPAGMVLAAPTRIWPLVRTPLLSPLGKLRALLEPFVPANAAVEDESLASFLSRRFGSEVATRIGAPLLGGIYAGDLSELGLHATFPQLALLEQRFGSVTFGLLLSSGRARTAPGLRRSSAWAALGSFLRAAPAHAPSPFLTLAGGLETLVDALRRSIGEERLRTGEALLALERAGDGYVLRTTRGSLRARRVLLTLPAPAAARALPPGRLADELSGIRYASSATAVFAFRALDVGRSLEGSGFLVPPGEGTILGATWVSNKWEGRAPAGTALMRVYVGGSQGGPALALADPELLELAESELRRLSGPLGPPLFSRLFRHPGVRPQPAVGHRERLERIQAELGQLPGVWLAGAGYDGSGIPDCIRQARAAARAMAERS